MSLRWEDQHDRAEWLRAAASAYRSAGERLVLDLRSTTQLDPVVGVWLEREALLGSISLDGGTTSLARDLPPTVDVHEAAVGLVDRSSPAIHEAICKGWPECPVHGHPLDVWIIDGGASWCCPATGDPYGDFGELRAI